MSGLRRSGQREHGGAPGCYSQKMRLGFAASFLFLISAVRVTAQVNPAQNLREGFTLPQPVAVALESAVAQQPDDEAARVKLIGYYSHRPAGVAAEEIRQRRAAHILWLIEKHPESSLFDYATPAWRIFARGGEWPDEAAFERAEALWLSHLEKNPAGERLKLHAAAFLQLGDPARAAELYRQGKQIRGVGTTYANYLLGVTALDPITGDPAAVDETQRASELGQRMAAELRASKETELVGGAGSTLAVMGGMLYSEGKTNWDYSGLAGELLVRAAHQDGENLEWAVVSPKLPARGEVTPKIMRVQWEQIKGALTKAVPPRYPARARSKRMSGMVYIHIAIGIDGKVMKSVLAGPAWELSDGVAEAVAQWEFKPIKIGVRPVIVLTTAAVDFTLTGGPSGR